MSRQRIAQPAVVRRTERGHEGRIGTERIGEEERRIKHLDADLFFIHDLKPRLEIGQLHAADAFGFARGVNRRFSIVARRRAEIVAATPHAPGKQLLVNVPVDHSIHSDDPRTLCAKSRIEIFIVESCRTFLYVTIGIDITHRSYLQAKFSVLIHITRRSSRQFSSHSLALLEIET